MWWSGTLADQKIKKRSTFTLAFFLDRQGRAFECNITMKNKTTTTPSFLESYRTAFCASRIGVHPRSLSALYLHCFQS